MSPCAARELCARALLARVAYPAPLSPAPHAPPSPPRLADEPDSTATGSGLSNLQAFSLAFFNNSAAAKYYHYGWLPEVTVRPDGTGSIVKHYSMGRFSHELAVVLPDERTVLFGDDSTNAAYFMYVANTARDLSAGTLYAAKLTTAFSLDPAAAAAKLSWIKLGSATDAEVWALADSKLVADIFNITTTNPNDASFTKIFVSGRAEYVKLVPGMEKAAAFLESRRYAAYLGATTQFTKLEGVTFNARDKVFYSALQNVQSSMVAGQASNDAAGFVSLGSATNAGAVTRSTLAAGQVDRAGSAIDSAWVPTDLGTLLVGKDISADALGNTADPTIMANPDNIKFSEAYRTLFIGEDCSQHVTCMVWAYNVDTKEYARLATVPAGAEATGLSVEDNINGFSYITANFQHPGEWLSVHANVRVAADPLIRRNYKNTDAAAVGYFKSVTAAGASAVQPQLGPSPSPSPTPSPSATLSPTPSVSSTPLVSSTPSTTMTATTSLSITATPIASRTASSTRSLSASPVANPIPDTLISFSFGMVSSDGSLLSAAAIASSPDVQTSIAANIGKTIGVDPTMVRVVNITDIATGAVYRVRLKPFLVMSK